jgi:lysozyme family protein
VTDDEILDGILARERGYVCDPSDPGCFTKSGQLLGCNWGLTPDEWAEALGRQVTAEDIKAATKEQARPVYAQKYLAPFAWIGDEALRVLATDTGVLEGQPWCILQLQAIANIITDGVCGPKTQAAVNALRPSDAVKQLLYRRVCREIKTALSDVNPYTIAHSRLKDLLGWWNRSFVVGVKPL